MEFLTDSKKEKREKKKTPKELAEKYSVILSFSNNQNLKLDFVINKKSKSAFFIKEDINFFSDSQKNVLRIIKDLNSWGEEIDIDFFFQNLKKSGFNLYYKDQKKIERIFWNKKSEKINLNFFRAKGKNFFPLNEGDFIVRAEDQWIFQKISKKSLFGKKKIYFLRDNFLESLELKKELLDIFKRIIEKKYDNISGFFSEKFETKLNEKEILKINYLIKELSEVFNLRTKIKNNFQIIENKKKEAVFEINYDREKEFLEIKPILDYGFKKIDISQSVLKNKRKNEIYLNRKFSSDLGCEYIISSEKNRIYYSRVDYNLEVEFYKKVYSFYGELGFNQKLKLQKNGIKQINNFIVHHWNNFKNFGFPIIYLKDKLDKKFIDFKADFDLKLLGNNDISLGVDFFLGNKKVGFQEIDKIFSQKNNEFFDGEGHQIEIKNKEELEKIYQIIKKFRREKRGRFQGKLYKALELKNIFTSSEYYNAKFNSGFKNFLSEIEGGNILEKIKIEKEYQKILRDYQKDGLAWMYFLKKYNFGGILADDMGLGKTIQALIMIEKNKIFGKPSIIIVPKTLIENWEGEIGKFLKNTKYLSIKGNQKERNDKIKKIKEYDLILTSYSYFQKDFLNYPHNMVFNYAVLDEAQYIKNFRSKNAQLVKQINADYRLALTGTPLENSISEVWSLFEFLMPGFLGNQSEFQKKYIKPIENGNKKVLENLIKKIQPFMLRRTKESVLKELPEKTISILKPELSDQQKALYQEIMSQVKRDLFQNDSGDLRRKYIHILAALTRLRQVCNHPNLIFKEDKYQKYTSSKLDIFLNLIKEIKSEERKVLVFSQFRSMLEILEKALNNKGIKNISLTGKSKNRSKIIKKFNEDKNISVFLISLKAGGIGLNLTSADNVILFDPWWNPSVEKQAIDRTHRIGQKNKVSVYKIITKDTVEEKILLLQKKKDIIFDSLVDENIQDLKTLSWDDLRKLFD